MSEADEIKRDGARAQKNSGRGTHAKGDAIWRDYVVDYKEYGNSFSVSRSVWAKICTDAWTVDPGKTPVLKLVLGSGAAKTRLAVVSWEHLAYLEEEIERLRNG